MLTAELAFLDAGLPDKVRLQTENGKYFYVAFVPLLGRQMLTPAKTCNLQLERENP